MTVGSDGVEVAAPPAVQSCVSLDQPKRGFFSVDLRTARVSTILGSEGLSPSEFLLTADSLSPLLALHFVVKPGFRYPQVASYGDGRYIEALRDFFHRQSGEIAEFYGFTLPRIHFLKLCEAVIENYNVPATLGLKARGFFQ